MALTAGEKKIVDEALRYAKGEFKLLDKGIGRAMRGIQDPARRRYLWPVLLQAAKEKLKKEKEVIMRATINVAQEKRESTLVILADAAANERYHAYRTD